MKIRLNEIPADGRAYNFDRKTGELNVALSDLIGEREYTVDLFIKPIGNAYEMRGHVKTALQEVCSTCGYEFELPVHRRVNEILFEDQQEDRKGHSVHGNQSVNFLEESGPSMTPYQNDILDAGDYVHEAIAIDEPLYPTCGPDGECLHKAEVDRIRAKLDADFAKAEEVKAEAGHPAFSVLKSLEIKDN